MAQPLPANVFCGGEFTTLTTLTTVLFRYFTFSFFLNFISFCLFDQRHQCSPFGN